MNGRVHSTSFITTYLRSPGITLQTNINSLVVFRYLCQQENRTNYQTCVIELDFAMEISEDNKPRTQSGIAHATRLNEIPDPNTTKKNHNMRYG